MSEQNEDGEDQRIEAARRCEQAVTHARVVSRARREEIDRAVDAIEQALWGAKETETMDVLVHLAREMLSDGRRR